MGNPLGIRNFGAFTLDAASQIALALASAGFATTGKVFYLDPVNGSDLANGQQPVASPGIVGTGPVQSLAAGYAFLRSGYNDVLVLMSDGASTSTARLTALFTWAKNAAHLIGIAAPSRFGQRARIAPTTTVTAFKSMFTVSGNACYFANIEWFNGFATGTTAQICMNVTGSRNVFNNCQISGMGDAASAADADSRSVVISTGENFFKHCVLGVDTIKRSALNATVELKSGAARNVFEDCIFPALASAAATSLAVLVAAAGKIDRMTVFTRCLFYNASTFSGGAAATGVIQLPAAVGGAILLQDCTEYGYVDWGYDAASKAEILVSGAVPTGATSGVAVVS